MEEKGMLSEVRQKKITKKLINRAPKYSIVGLKTWDQCGPAPPPNPQLDTEHFRDK